MPETSDTPLTTLADAAFRQAPSPDCPASALQAHPNVIVFADQAAIPNGV